MVSHTKRCKELHDAKAAGDIFYFTGKPCKYGHISKRRVSTQQCYECMVTIHGPKDRDNYRYKDTFKRQFDQRKAKAKQSNIPFTITFDQLHQPTHCPILGIELNYGWSGKNRRDPAKASIDKVVPELGYVPGNLYVISWKANKLKSSASIAELESIIRYMKERTNNETI